MRRGRSATIQLILSIRELFFPTTLKKKGRLVRLMDGYRYLVDSEGRIIGLTAQKRHASRMRAQARMQNSEER